MGAKSPSEEEGQIKSKRTSLKTMNPCTSSLLPTTTSNSTKELIKSRKYWTGKKMRKLKPCYKASIHNSWVFSMTIIAKIASKKVTELGHVPLKWRTKFKLSVLFVGKLPIPLWIVHRNRRTWKSSKLTTLQFCWSLNTTSLDRTYNINQKEE